MAEPTNKELLEADSITKGTGNVKLVLDTARKLYKLGTDIEKLEADLKLKKAEHFKLSTETLPDLMESEGVTSLSLTNGYQLVVEDVFRANIPAESTIERADEEEAEALLKRRSEGLSWLRKNRGGDIIKNQLKIDLGRGADAIAKKFAALAKATKVPISQSERVDPRTLANFLKELLAKGKDVPVETFALFRGREAVIEKPKAKKEPKHGKGK